MNHWFSTRYRKLFSTKPDDTHVGQAIKIMIAILTAGLQMQYRKVRLNYVDTESIPLSRHALMIVIQKYAYLKLCIEDALDVFPNDHGTI